MDCYCDYDAPAFYTAKVVKERKLVLPLEVKP